MNEEKLTPENEPVNTPPEPDYSQGDAACQPPLKDTQQKEKLRFTLLSAEDLYALPDPEWLIEDTIPENHISCVYGNSGAGKSFLVLDMALAVADGCNWFGKKVKQRPVVYICQEGEGFFKYRVKAWEIENNKKIPREFKVILDPFLLSDDVDELIKYIMPNSLIIIDTLKASSPNSSEVDDKDVANLIKQVEKLKAIGTPLIIHHSGKDASKGPRGHSGFRAALDALILVEKKKDGAFWTIEKARHSREGDSYSFKLKIQTVGYDEQFQKPKESCTIEPSNITISIKQDNLPAQLQEAFNCLVALCHKEKTNRILTDKWRQEVVKNLPPKNSSKRGYYNYRRQELIKRKYIREEQGFTILLR